MYFDAEPKRDIRDFFDMEEPLRNFESALNKGKLVVVSGLRRYGKTSLILTALNKMNVQYLFLDARLLSAVTMISINDFLGVLEDALNRVSWSKTVLKSVEGVEVGGFGVRFRNRSRETLLHTLHALSGKVIVIDEAQLLRRSSVRFDQLLAYIYDHVDAKVVVSGSQVGLLYRFLRVGDEDAPLFGRPYIEIRLGRLPPEKSRQFLLKGFSQERIHVDDALIDKAVSLFDGVIGWLTYFGFTHSRSKEQPEDVFRKASQLAAKEVSSILNTYGIAKRRYVEVLRTIASSDQARWSEIKRGVEARLGRIPNNTLANILRNLVDSGLIERHQAGYTIPDPALKNGVLHHFSGL